MRALNSLINSVTPHMVAAAFAQPGSIREKDGSVYATFFQGDGEVEYRLFGNGFISMSDPRPITCVGLLSRMYAENNPVGTAIENLISRFEDHVPEYIRRDGSMFVSHIDYGERVFERLMELLMMRRFNMASIAGTASLECAAWKNSPIGTANILTQSELKEVVDLLGVSYKTGGITFAVVVPMFSNTCTLSALWIQAHKRNSSSPENPEVVRIEPAYRHAYTNFHTFKPSSILFIHPSPEAALEAMMDSRNDTEAHTFAAHWPESELQSWLPRACYCTITSDEQLLPVIYPFAEDGVICRATKATTAPQVDILGSVSWEGAIADAVVSRLAEADVIDDFSSMLLASVQNNAEAQRKIISGLEKVNNTVLANEISHMHRTGLIWNNGDQFVYETPSGYVHEDSRTKALGGTQVTNFTITPSAVSVYEAGDRFYHCDIRVRGEERQMAIPAHMFDSLRKLCEYIQTGIELSGRPTIVPPAIFESSLARPILGWLIEKFSRMDRKPGRSYLGWAPDAKTFKGITGDVVFKPTVPHLQGFVSPPVPKRDKRPELPPFYQSVLRACAGIIARAYTNSEQTPVLFLNTPATREVLRRIFSLAGQTEIIRLNPNMRNSAELQCFQGYPVLTTGYNSNQAKASKVGMILLGEKGIELKDEPDAALATETASAIVRVIEDLPSWIIQRGGLPCVFASEDVTSEHIIADGETILQYFYQL